MPRKYKPSKSSYLIKSNHHPYGTFNISIMWLNVYKCDMYIKVTINKASCQGKYDTIYPVSVYENEGDEQDRVKVHYWLWIRV